MQMIDIKSVVQILLQMLLLNTTFARHISSRIQNNPVYASRRPIKHASMDSIKLPDNHFRITHASEARPESAIDHPPFKGVPSRTSREGRRIHEMSCETWSIQGSPDPRERVRISGVVSLAPVCDLFNPLPPRPKNSFFELSRGEMPRR